MQMSDLFARMTNNKAPLARFSYNRMHIPSGRVQLCTTKDIWPTDMPLTWEDFYRLLDKWNAQGGSLWKYWAA